MSGERSASRAELFGAKPDPKGPAIDVRDLCVAIDGASILDHLSFHVPRGAFAAVIGPNGAGKTTLLRSLLGLVPTMAGEAYLLGVPVGRLGDVATRVGYVPQRLEFDRRFPATVREVVLFGRIARLGFWRRPGARDHQLVDECLRAVGIRELAERPIGVLSGGELQRASLARALASEPELLLLDEPTNGMDLPAQDQFYELLQSLRHEGCLTLLVVTHDLIAIAKHADELLCVNRHLHIHGSPDCVLESNELRVAYRCEYDFLARDPHVHLHSRSHAPGEPSALGHVHVDRGSGSAEGPSAGLRSAPDVGPRPGQR